MSMGVIILIAVVVIAFAIWQAKVNAERERLRRAALADFAAQNGLRFDQNDYVGIDGRYTGIEEIGRGHSHYAYDVIHRDGPPLTAFQYQYKTWETRTVTTNGQTRTETYEETHYCKYLIIELGGQFPGLSLRPEGLFDKLKGFVGFGDINFESEEFSRKYFCASDNKEFAYAVIHPQMIEYLMNLGIQFHLQGQLLVMNLARYHFDAAGVAGAMTAMGGVVNRIPDFVWQDYGKAPPVKFPEIHYTPPAAPAQ